MYSKLKSLAIAISAILTVTTCSLNSLGMGPDQSAIGQSTSGDMAIQEKLDEVSFTLKVLQNNLRSQIESYGQTKYEYSKLERVINEKFEELRINNPLFCVFKPNLIENQVRFRGFTKKELLEFEQKKIDEAQKKVDEAQERINKAQQRYDALKEQYDTANSLTKDNQD